MKENNYGLYITSIVAIVSLSLQFGAGVSRRKVAESTYETVSKDSLAGQAIGRRHIKKPNWRPVIYTNSMTAYFDVTVDGKPLPESSLFAAFVDGEVRASKPIIIHEGKSYSTFVIQGKCRRKNKIQSMEF